MILLGNILIAISSILGMILFVVNILILAYVVISWVNADPYNSIVRFIHSAVDPMLRVVRRHIKTTFGRIDIAPILLYFVVVILQLVVVKSLNDYGHAFVVGSY